MMGIRSVCFVIAVVLFINHFGWLTAIPAVGAILIPCTIHIDALVPRRSITAGVPGPRRNADDRDAGWFAPVATRRRPMLGAFWPLAGAHSASPGGRPRAPRGPLGIGVLAVGLLLSLCGCSGFSRPGCRVSSQGCASGADRAPPSAGRGPPRRSGLGGCTGRTRDDRGAEDRRRCGPRSAEGCAKILRPVPRIGPRGRRHGAGWRWRGPEDHVGSRGCPGAPGSSRGFRGAERCGARAGTRGRSDGARTRRPCATAAI